MVVILMPNPKSERSPLVVCPRLLIHYICSYSPLLEAAHPSEDVPCCGDKGAHQSGVKEIMRIFTVEMKEMSMKA
jgi:hypothetical protein